MLSFWKHFGDELRLSSCPNPLFFAIDPLFAAIDPLFAAGDPLFASLLAEWEVPICTPDHDTLPPCCAT